MQRYSSCKQSHENMLLMCMIFFPLLLVSYPGMYNYAEVKLHLRSYKNKHRLCFPLPQNPSTWYFINHSHCLSLFFFLFFLHDTPSQCVIASLIVDRCDLLSWKCAAFICVGHKQKASDTNTQRHSDPGVTWTQVWGRHKSRRQFSLRLLRRQRREDFGTGIIVSTGSVFWL